MEILKEKKPLGEVDSYISGLFDNKCHNNCDGEKKGAQQRGQAVS